MGLTDKQLRDFAEYLMPEKKESPTMQINATVHSIDSTGEKPVYYVNFDGAEGTEPCPVNSTIAEGERTLAAGDRVIVLVKDREGTIVGNIDKPIETSEAYDDSWLLGEDGALAEAAKYATNYMKFTSGQYDPRTNPNAGLVLSENATATNLGRNLQLMSGGIMIRNNSQILASFDENDIYLGLNSSASVIHFCGDKGSITYTDRDDVYMFEMLSNGPVSIYSYDNDSIYKRNSQVLCNGNYLMLASHYEDQYNAYMSRLSVNYDGINLASDYSIELVSYGSMYLESDVIRLNAASTLKYSGTVEHSYWSNTYGTITVQYRPQVNGLGLWCNNGFYSGGELRWESLPSGSGSASRDNGTLHCITSGEKGYYVGFNTSSKYLKHDIKDPVDIDCNKLYELPVRQFRWNEDDALDLGFIADEMAEIFSVGAIYREDYRDGKEPADWRERVMIPAMLKLIQDQHADIENLKEKVYGKPNN